MAFWLMLTIFETMYWAYEHSIMQLFLTIACVMPLQVAAIYVVFSAKWPHPVITTIVIQIIIAVIMEFALTQILT